MCEDILYGYVQNFMCMFLYLSHLLYIDTLHCHRVQQVLLIIVYYWQTCNLRKTYTQSLYRKYEICSAPIYSLY